MRGFDLNWENGTLLGFVFALVAGVLLLILGGAKFGLIRLILYIVLALTGIILFAVYSNGRERNMKASAAMIVVSLIMIFVFPVGFVINVVILVGSGVLFLRILSKMRGEY